MHPFNPPLSEESLAFCYLYSEELTSHCPPLGILTHATATFSMWSLELLPTFWEQNTPQTLSASVLGAYLQVLGPVSRSFQELSHARGKTCPQGSATMLSYEQGPYDSGRLYCQSSSLLTLKCAHLRRCHSLAQPETSLLQNGSRWGRVGKNYNLFSLHDAVYTFYSIITQQSLVSGIPCWFMSPCL